MAAKKQYATGYQFGGSELSVIGSATANDSVPTWAQVKGVRVEKTSADETNNTTTPSNISSLAVAVDNSSTYDFEFLIPYSMSGTGNGISFDITGPTTTFLSYSIEIQTNTTTMRADYKTAFSSAVTLSSTGSTSTFRIWVHGRMTTSASGTVQPRYAIGSGTGQTATVKTGALGRAVKT